VPVPISNGVTALLSTKFAVRDYLCAGRLAVHGGREHSPAPKIAEQVPLELVEVAETDDADEAE
jgi:hypothetical protein